MGGRLVRVWASWRREPQIPGGLVSFFLFLFFLVIPRVLQVGEGDQG